MDFTSAMETFAEAWVAANTQTAVTDQVSKCSNALDHFQINLTCACRIANVPVVIISSMTHLTATLWPHRI